MATDAEEDTLHDQEVVGSNPAWALILASFFLSASIYQQCILKQVPRSDATQLIFLINGCLGVKSRANQAHQKWLLFMKAIQGISGEFLILKNFIAVHSEKANMLLF